MPEPDGKPGNRMNKPEICTSTIRSALADATGEDHISLAQSLDIALTYLYLHGVVPESSLSGAQEKIRRIAKRGER